MDQLGRHHFRYDSLCRAFVVSVRVDAEGREIAEPPQIRRAIINNHRKLSYNGVQKFFDGQNTRLLEKSNARDASCIKTLEALRDVGQKLIDRADERGVVPILDPEQSVHPRDSQTGSCELSLRQRNSVEYWNEQISVLINHKVGEFIQSKGVLSLHRVHPQPNDLKIAHFREQVSCLKQPFEGSRLSDYIRGLSQKEAQAKKEGDNLTVAGPIRMLAARTNEKAYYSIEALGHAALALDSYDHFTAPMRRYTDILTHRILASLVEDTPVPYQDDKGAFLMAMAEQAAWVDHRNTDVELACVRHVEAKSMVDYVGQTLPGTIVSMSAGGFNVRLDSPPAVVRVQLGHLNHASGGAFHMLPNGVVTAGRRGKFALGDRISVNIKAADPERDHVDALPEQFCRSNDGKASHESKSKMSSRHIKTQRSPGAPSNAATNRTALHA